MVMEEIKQLKTVPHQGPAQALLDQDWGCWPCACARTAWTSSRSTTWVCRERRLKAPVFN